MNSVIYNPVFSLSLSGMVVTLQMDLSCWDHRHSREYQNVLSRITPLPAHTAHPAAAQDSLLSGLTTF